MKIKWETKTLGEVCEIGAGNSAPQKKEMFEEGEYPFFRTSDVGKIHLGIIYDSVDMLNQKGIEKLKLFPEGTLLFPKSGASTFLNHRVLMGINGYVSSHLATIKAKEKFLLDSFLYYYSRTIDSRNLMQDQNYPSLRLSDISNIEINFPSLETQKQIVKILDEVFESISKSKENAEKNLKNAKELFESYLEEIFSNPKEGWEEKKLGDLFDVKSSRRVHKKDWKKEGVPFYRAREVVKLAKEGFVNNDLFISEELYKKFTDSNGYPKEGDIIISAVGTLGQCYLVKKEDKFYFKDASVLWFNKISNVDSRYIEYSFKSNPILKQISNGSMGATVGTLTISRAGNIQIPVPTYQEQKAIVKKLDDLSSEIKQLEEIYNQKVKDLEELKKSMLQKAFSGELTKE